MKHPWFKRIGLLFLPQAIAGWVILIAAIVYSVYAFIDIDGRSHSVSDTLMNFTFRLLIITVIYSLVGLITTRKGGKAAKHG